MPAREPYTHTVVAWRGPVAVANAVVAFGPFRASTDPCGASRDAWVAMMQESYQYDRLWAVLGLDLYRKRGHIPARLSINKARERWPEVIDLTPRSES